MTEASSEQAPSTGGRRQLGLGGKLIAAMTIPVVLLVAAAAVLFANRVADNTTAANDDKLARVAQPARATEAAVAAERTAVGGGERVPAARLDSAAKQLRSAVRATDLPAGGVTEGWRRVAGQLDRLGSVRGLAKADRSAAMRGYTAVLNALLGFERAALSATGSQDAVQHGAGLAALSTARAELANQHGILLAGIARGKLTRKESTTLHDAGVRFDAAVARFRAVAPGQDRATYGKTVVNADTGRHKSMVSDALKPGPITIDSQAWTEASKAVAGELRAVSGTIDGRLRTATGAEHAQTSTALLATGIAAVVAILLAAAIAALSYRRVLRSVRSLHRGARNVVQSSLPQALAELRAGRTVDTEPEPLPVHGGDELGQTARAFDAVHSEALGLAAGQAEMRTSYGTIFVNLSRRSQTLVQRQLRLIEQLERDEQDAEDLATLFTLDHLATRMRRNNENLMVLSGAEPNRGPTQHPVALEELLRAAVSEIEQYGRVTLEAPPAVTVLGYAAGDLIRLLAELLDNATAFSAPETTVTVAAERDNDGSLLLRISDRGLGMQAHELAAINERLAGNDAEEVPTSRQMGLFVVGRLARRQSVQVALRAGTEAGVVAGVRVPARLVAASAEPGGGSVRDFEAAAPAERGIARGGQDGDDTVETLLPQPAEPYGSTGPPAPRKPRQQPTPTGARARAEREAAQQQEATQQRAAQQHAAQQHAAQQHAAQEEAAAGGRGEAGTAGESPERTHAGLPRRAPSAPRPERTPIFDSLLPAWFAEPGDEQHEQPPAPPQRNAGAQPGDELSGHQGEPAAGLDEGTASRTEPGTERGRWQSPADAGWQAVEEVAEVEPERFTTAGLPQRTPRARLLPGSAPEPERTSDGPKHSADTVRNRLASFQRGLQRGRHSSDAEPPEPPPADHADDPELFAAEQSGATGEATPGQAGHSWAFSPHGEAPANGERWHGAETPAEAAPTEVMTAAGLPRRTPQPRRAPEGRQPPPPADPPGAPDAEGMRSRLANFQRGVSAGRRNTGMPEPELDEDEHAYQWENE